jgi:hypothetical protein
MAYPTNPIYKLQKDIDGSVNSVNTRVGNATISIPFDPANTDYQDYLEWVAAGNTAEEAD